MHIVIRLNNMKILAQFNADISSLVVRCESLMNRTNLQLNSSHTSWRTNVRITCEQGYVITSGVTEMTTYCKADGQWSQNFTSCQRK